MISLVTACMNREAHLRRTLPHWLALPGIDEIVIVDWSTSKPIDDLLSLDPRVRIVRVVGESRWILSYAYNLGIAHARGNILLKCDADCLPHPEVLQQLPASGTFFAGDWRSGDHSGKTCVNGQCLFTRAQWEQVNGYSEVIRRYGYDDTDFYMRLEKAGHVRREISPAHLDFAEHTDVERIANHVAPAQVYSVEMFLHQHIHYHEIMNMVIISFLPWGPWFSRAVFEERSSGDRVVTVQRSVAGEIPISATLAEVARVQAMRTMAGRLCRIAPEALARMSDAACMAMLSQLVRTQQSRVSVNGPAVAVGS